MRGNPAFAQVLEEKLREWTAAEAPLASSYTKYPRREAAHQARAADPFIIREVRRKRVLKPCEQNALASLNQLGACLSSDYSARDLRRAFRILARQYHPDRHPSSDVAEQARLAHLFSTIAEHHRCLATAFERDNVAPN